MKERTPSLGSAFGVRCDFRVCGACAVAYEEVISRVGVSRECARGAV